MGLGGDCVVPLLLRLEKSKGGGASLTGFGHRVPSCRLTVFGKDSLCPPRNITPFKRSNCDSHVLQQSFEMPIRVSGASSAVKSTPKFLSA